MPQTSYSSRRVLMVAVDFKPLSGGVSEFAYQMARGFMKLGAEVLILSPYYSGVETHDDQINMRIKRTWPPYIPGRGLGITPKIRRCASLAGLATAMLKMRKTFQPHIVYFPSMYPLATLPYSNGSIVTTFHGRELSFYCRDVWFAGVNKRLLQRSCKNSSLILANSSYTKSLLIELGIDDSKIFVSGCGVNWDRFCNVPDSEQARSKLGLSNKKVIFSLGRLDDRKGFDSVIKCVHNIQKKFSDILYIIAGKGPQKAELETLITRLGLRDYVRLVGPISDEVVIDYMAACDIFAMPNKRTTDRSVEGFGIVLLEANCCGKPVVAGRSGGVVDAVEHNKTGLIVDPYSQQDIENAIEMLLGNPQLAAKLGQQGKERVEKYFKWEYIAERACQQILERAG